MANIDQGRWIELPVALQKRHAAIYDRWAGLRRELCLRLFAGDDSVRPLILNLDSAMEIGGNALIAAASAGATLKIEQILTRLETSYERFELAAAAQNGRK